MIDYFETHDRFRLASALTAIFAMLNALLLPSLARAQDAGPPAFNRKQIEALVAPIALYPDPLLTHVLMASTYPLEVVQAARWREEHPDINGGDLEGALQDVSWDESVRALTAFPQVLTMMNEKLDWTQKLGEAFLAQQDDVFAAVQDLRRRAQTAGSLKDSREMKIVDVPADNGPSYIEIEPAGPDEIYVPVYDPTVVYGAWAYDDYPPYYWYPHGWNRDRVFWYGTAAVLGVALWAAWDWRRHHIQVDAGRFNRFNRANVANPAWSFKPQHRAGVPFKAPVLAKKFGPIAGPSPKQKLILKQHLNPAVVGKGNLPTGKGNFPSGKGNFPSGKTTTGTKFGTPGTPGVGTGHKDHKPLNTDNTPKFKNTAPVHKEPIHREQIHRDVVKPKEHTFVKPHNNPPPRVNVQKPVIQKQVIQKQVIQRPVSRPPPPPKKNPNDQKH